MRLVTSSQTVRYGFSGEGEGEGERSACEASKQACGYILCVRVQRPNARPAWAERVCMRNMRLPLRFSTHADDDDVDAAAAAVGDDVFGWSALDAEATYDMNEPIISIMLACGVRACVCGGKHTRVHASSGAGTRIRLRNSLDIMCYVRIDTMRLCDRVCSLVGGVG